MRSDNSRALRIPANVAHPQHPVIQEIQRRRALLHRGQDLSGLETKLGLVVEGGGMRGVLSCGALIALEQLGLSAVFDEVYGESAGAINACYFLAAQVAFGGRIYLEDLPSLRFINPLRPTKILDIDFLVDHVMTRVKPLHVPHVLRARSQLFISLTNANDGTARVVDVKHEPIPLLMLLKASASIIPLYNKAVLLDGIPYADGGIADPLPVKTGIRRQCTHLLVLLTRPCGYSAHPYQGFQRLLLQHLLRRWDPRFVMAFFEGRYRRYNEARRIAFGEISTGNAVQIAVICPTASTPNITRVTVQQHRLRAAMDHSIRHTLQLFGLSVDTQSASAPRQGSARSA
jgi:predicted patatin/cPLA2 family phospholipase